MKKVTIRLNTINDVKEFVSSVSLCDFEVDLVSGRYSIDAKSIMGIFSLDLSQPVELHAHVDACDEFFAEIDKFIQK
ncbi:MAG: HPr family phosphocarrier protein [Oscillospiraceae bacterium]|nr:HPr family phosphocarrier protein [Oscillospiraceae bacterium]